MKFIDFTRVDNDITGVLEDNTKVPMTWDYIVEYKPQIGDEYEIVAAPVAVPAASTVTPPAAESAPVEAPVAPATPVEQPASV